MEVACRCFELAQQVLCASFASRLRATQIRTMCVICFAKVPSHRNRKSNVDVRDLMLGACCGIVLHLSGATMGAFADRRHRLRSPPSRSNKPTPPPPIATRHPLRVAPVNAGLHLRPCVCHHSLRLCTFVLLPKVACQGASECDNVSPSFRKRAPLRARGMCIDVDTCAYAYIYRYTNAHACIHIYTYTYMHIHMHAYMRTRIHTYMHIHTNIKYSHNSVLHSPCRYEFSRAVCRRHHHRHSSTAVSGSVLRT